MLKVITTSDTHLGLKTDEIDRNEEIVQVVSEVVNRAIEYKIAGHEVILVLGGDIFDNNTPSEKDISALLIIFNLIKVNDIKTYFLLGNHEAVSDPDRLSCLGFIRKAKVGYPSITLIEDIKFLKIGDYNNGPLYFTFLPHITKGTIELNKRSGEYEEASSTQDYIEKKCKMILKKVAKGSQHYVFSHLNVKGAHPGSEENLLRKSEVYLPSCFTNTPVGFITPTIIQYHIHSHQVIGNINIVGSPIFCGFGEKGPKYYADITISTELGKKDNIDFVETSYRPFFQIELNMVNAVNDFFAIEDVCNFLILLEENLKRNPVAKINVTINAENNSYDWSEIRKTIVKKFKGVYLKPIVPRVLTAKTTRSAEQKITLAPSEAVKVYLRKNVKDDPNKKKRIYQLSKKYWE